MPDQEIISCEDQLRSAMLAGDVVALDRLIDDDLAFISHEGAVVGKAADLAAHAARTLQLTHMAPSDSRIRRYGDVAVVTVRMAVKGTYADVPFDTAFRYLRVWHLRDGAWRIVAGQMNAAGYPEGLVERVAQAVVTGMLVVLAGTLPRNVLFAANLRYFTGVPWAVPLTALYLWYFWRYLNGAGAPASSAHERRASLRARRRDRGGRH